MPVCREATRQRLLWKWAPSTDPGASLGLKDQKRSEAATSPDGVAHSPKHATGADVIPSIYAGGSFVSSSMLLGVPAWGGTELRVNHTVIRNINGGHLSRSWIVQLCRGRAHSHRFVGEGLEARQVIWEPYELRQLYIESAERNGTVVSFAYIIGWQSASPRAIGRGDVGAKRKNRGLHASAGGTAPHLDVGGKLNSVSIIPSSRRRTHA